MSLVLSIFHREFATMQRRTRFYLRRITLVAVGGLIIGAGLVIGGSTPTTAVGLRIFMSLLFSALVGMTIMALMSSASLIMREKEDETLGILFLSDVSTGAFVIGKLFMALFSSVMTILSVLPIFMLSMSLGGISAPQVLAAFAILLSTVFLMACIGLLVASMARSERSMNILLAIFCVLFFVGLPGLIMLPSYLTGMEEGGPSRLLLCLFSPIVAMDSIIRGFMLGASFASGAINVGLGIPILLLTMLILPHRIHKNDRPSAFHRFRIWIRANRFFRSLFGPRPIRGNPVAWKDYYFGHGGTIVTVVKFALSLAVTAGATYAIYTYTTLIKGSAYDTILLGLFAFSAVVILLSGIAHCARSFHREKKTNALDCLLITSLTNRHIVYGKIRAAFMTIVPWLIVMSVLGGLLYNRYSGTNQFKAYVWGFIFEFPTTWAGYSLFALYLSMRCKRNIAFAMTILLMLVWNTLGRMMFMAFTLQMYTISDLVMLDFAFHFTLGALSLFLLKLNLREGERLDAF